jgi:hypothetical protein
MFHKPPQFKNSFGEKRSGFILACDLGAAISHGYCLLIHLLSSSVAFVISGLTDSKF